MVFSFLFKAAAFCRISWIESSRTAQGSKGEAPLPGLRLSQTDPSLVDYRIAANSLSEDGQGVQQAIWFPIAHCVPLVEVQAHGIRIDPER